MDITSSQIISNQIETNEGKLTPVNSVNMRTDAKIFSQLPKYLFNKEYIRYFGTT